MQAKGKKPNKSEIKRLYIRESRSIRDTAEIMGCSKDMVFRAIKECGIQSRKHSVKRSKLHDYSLSYLKREVKMKGQTQVAKEIGINQSTLSRYLKKHKW